MYPQPSESKQNAPTHAERIMDLRNRIMVLESLVAQLTQALADSVGIHIAGVPTAPQSAPGGWQNQ